MTTNPDRKKVALEMLRKLEARRRRGRVVDMIFWSVMLLGGILLALMFVTL